MFRQGVLTAVSNPKALLFYGAFLPQLIDPGRALVIPFIVMTTTFVALCGARPLCLWVKPWRFQFRAQCVAVTLRALSTPGKQALTCPAPGWSDR